MEIGDIIQATVTRIENYGIWLDSSGRIGLLLIVDISSKRIRHPSEVAKVGDILTVKVIRLVEEKDQFVASLKELEGG
jgi:small subunit ribosomal protein S1